MRIYVGRYIFVWLSQMRGCVATEEDACDCLGRRTIGSGEMIFTLCVWVSLCVHLTNDAQVIGDGCDDNDDDDGGGVQEQQQRWWDDNEYTFLDF